MIAYISAYISDDMSTHADELRVCISREVLRAVTFTSTESKSGQTEQFREKKFCLTQLLKAVIKVPGHG